MKPNAPKPQRCAIYTRKSTEHNLDLAFNSLDAQREACEAYVTSQKHEGWSALPTLYDDGAYSGGSMDRPALQRLLDDVRAGALVQTLEVEPSRGLEVTADHLARTAFQISGPVLS